MSPKRNGNKRHHHHSKPSTSNAATNPLPDLPDHIITDILKRLPVKSIMRFKCVSKEWLSLLSSPKFISMHHEETSNNPFDHSFIIRSIKNDHHCHEMSLLNFKSIGRRPVSLINPLPVPFEKMELVGTINGLVCLNCPPRVHMTILWNPSMNLYKVISLCICDGDTRKISMGFAHDSATDDYKIIRIECIKETRSSEEVIFRYKVEVYSANLDSWERVQIDSPIALSESRSNVIVKGIPYWTGFICQGSIRPPILVYYDMQNGSFKHFELPLLTICPGIGRRFMEWKGNLGIIMSSPSKGREGFADIFLYDEIGMCWNRLSSQGSINLKRERYIQCSRNGVILAETEEGKLMLYDPLTNDIKKFSIPGAFKLSFEAFAYIESLITVKGMEQV